MKVSLINIFLFLLATGPLTVVAQSTKGFTISGRVEGLIEGETVKLGHRFKGDWHHATIIDSCKVTNGSFNLKGGFEPDAPHAYEILFNRDLHVRLNPKTGGAMGGFWIDFFADNGEDIMISGGNINELGWDDFTPFVTVQGSPSSDAFKWAGSLAKYADSCLKKIGSRLTKIRDSIGYDRNLVEKQINLKQKLDQHLDSAFKNASVADRVAIPYFINLLRSWVGGYHGYFIKGLFNTLSTQVQNSYEGKLAKNFAQLSVGQAFPVFSLEADYGKQINLKNFVKKNKITLVHFFGPGSIECDKMQKEVAAMHNRFSTKGMDVIAVTTDTTGGDLWKLTLPRFPWTYVIAEPRGWGAGSLVNDLYGEGGRRIPNTTNVLLDSKGNILAWDVYGPELQYYLEKYLGPAQVSKSKTSSIK